ncbi:MAG: ATPase [Candidatus Lokiarchaeota archaeon]|nr:ATPase [Candidatus Lokiarchaeota archaeon]MCK4479138.1 ATPase [Candidatus Lokiarchaeota archaeon]
MNGKHKFYLLLGSFQIILIFLVIFTSNGIISLVAAQVPDAFDYYDSATTMVLGLAVAISVSASVLGSAWAMKTVGTAAISALSEREEAFFKAFLVVALCEALAVYGLIVAILLWTKIPTPITN